MSLIPPSLTHSFKLALFKKFLQLGIVGLNSGFKMPLTLGIVNDQGVQIDFIQWNLHFERGQPLYKGQMAGSQVCPFFGGSTAYVGEKS